MIEKLGDTPPALVSEATLRELRNWCQPRPNTIEGWKQPRDSWQNLTSALDELLTARARIAELEAELASMTKMQQTACTSAAVLQVERDAAVSKVAELELLYTALQSAYRQQGQELIAAVSKVAELERERAADETDFETLAVMHERTKAERDSAVEDARRMRAYVQHLPSCAVWAVTAQGARRNPPHVLNQSLCSCGLAALSRAPAAKAAEGSDAGQIDKANAGPKCDKCIAGRELIDVVGGEPVSPLKRTYGAVWKPCRFCAPAAKAEDK